MVNPMKIPPRPISGSFTPIRRFASVRAVAAATVLSSLLAALGGCGTSSRAGQPATQDVVTSEPLTDQRRALFVQSFDVVWETVRDSHWDPTLGGVDWNAARAELRPRVETAQTASDAQAATSELLARLGQSHFGLIPSNAYASMSRPKHTPSKSDSTQKASASNPTPEATADSAPTAEPKTDAAADETATDETATDETDSPGADLGTPGLTIRVVRNNRDVDQALVTMVDPGSSADKAGIRPGWVLLDANSRGLAARLATVRSSMGNLPSPRLEAALVMSVGSILNGPMGSTVEVLMLDGAGKRVRHTLTRGAPRGQLTTFGNLPPIPVDVRTGRVDNTIGYITFTAFLDPPRVMGEINSAMAGFGNTDGIVLDLRGNPGGLGIMATGVGGWFITKPGQKLGTMNMRSTELRFILNPRPTPYTKPLAILIDGMSMSTSEILAGGLQDLGRARVFGTPSAGAALPSQIIRLPSGDGLQFAVASYTSTAGQELEGAGVTPDEVVMPTREALLRGEDPALDAAIAWIRRGGQPIRN